jgi:hypothetical protein
MQSVFTSALTTSEMLRTVSMLSQQEPDAEGSRMTFDELLTQILDLPQRDGRVSYRALKRRFELDEEYLEDLKAEIVQAKKLAVDEDGAVLVWTGGLRIGSLNGLFPRRGRRWPLAHLRRQPLRSSPRLPRGLHSHRAPARAASPRSETPAATADRWVKRDHLGRDWHEIRSHA